MGAINRSWRNPPTKVVVFQWPCGTEATQRRPLGDRPRLLAMLVVVHVSWIKTSLRGSSSGWFSRHSARAIRTSSRSFSLACRGFFKRQIPLVQLMPKRGNLDLNPGLGQALTDLG